MTAKKWRFWKLFLWGHLPLCKSGWCSIKPSDFSKDHHHCQGQLDEVYGKKGQIQIHRELYKFIYLNQVNYFCSFVLRIKNLFKKSIVIFLHLMDSYVLIIVAAYGTHIFKCAIKDNFGFQKYNTFTNYKLFWIYLEFPYWQTKVSSVWSAFFLNIYHAIFYKKPQLSTECIRILLVFWFWIERNP